MEVNSNDETSTSTNHLIFWVSVHVFGWTPFLYKPHPPHKKTNKKTQPPPPKKRISATSKKLSYMWAYSIQLSPFGGGGVGLKLIFWGIGGKGCLKLIHLGGGKGMSQTETHPFSFFTKTETPSPQYINWLLLNDEMGREGGSSIM